MNHETTSKRVGRKRGQRREAIVAAARGLVERRGVEGFTIAELAGALDYTPGALYRYFNSKEAIIAELQSESATAVARALRETLDAWDADSLSGSPGQRTLGALIVAAAFYRGLEARMPASYLLLTQLASHPRPILDDDNAQVPLVPLTSLLGVVAALFQRAAQEGSLTEGPGPMRAVLYWSALAGVLQTRKLARFSTELFDDASLVDELVTSLLRGFGADAAKLTQAADAAGTFYRSLETRGDA